jgi:hypothetical protein
MKSNLAQFNPAALCEILMLLAAMCVLSISAPRVVGQSAGGPVSPLSPSFPEFAAACKSVRIVKIADHGVIHRYFDTSPISPSGRYVALLRVPYENKPAQPGDAADVIVVDLQTGEERKIATSRAWGHQLGANVQWGVSDHELYYNDTEPADWSCFGIRLDPISGISRKLGGTVFMVSPDGRLIASDNQTKTSRYVQESYGAALPEAYTKRNVGVVDDDGVYMMDVATGKSRILVSTRQIYEQTIPSIRIAHPESFEYYCFQVKWNAQGTRLLVTFQWSPLGGDKAKRTRAVITMRPDGSELRTAVTPVQWAKGGHHINWAPDGEHMTMNLEADGAPGYEIVRFRPDGSEFEIIYPKGSGHPSINPHYPFLVTDAYPWESFAIGDGSSPLRLIDLRTKKEVIIANIAIGMGGGSGLRVDPHPVWDASGRFLVFDGFVGGTRNVYLADLTAILTGKESIGPAR